MFPAPIQVYKLFSKTAVRCMCGVMNTRFNCHISNIRHKTSRTDLNKVLKMSTCTRPESVANKIFKFTDYDCIGFDLDNTVARYKVGAMIDMEYDIISRFLVEKKGYSREHLLHPLDHNFLIKGLIVDDHNGNLVRIDQNGVILQATHGTKFLNDDEILKYYPNRHWEVTDVFAKNPLETWNGPHSESMRTLLDYYDMCVSIVFARAVDSIDEKVHKRKDDVYNIWPDILEALVYMFDRDHFKHDIGEYFPAMKKTPEKFYYKCSDLLKNWFKSLRSSGKLLFLITGSHVDFASHTASNTLGPNWRDYFDVVVCYAKKPGFFTLRRNFIGLNNITETGPVDISELRINGIYTHGNWVELRNFLKHHSKKADPKFLYVGDNLVQDIYTPNVYAHCDTVSVCEELEAEGVHGHQQWHPDEQFLVSTIWGSYFHCRNTNKITNWYHIMKKHSKVCVPSLEYVASLPFDYSYEANELQQI